MSKSYRRDPDFSNNKNQDRRRVRQTSARNKRAELDRAAERTQPIDYTKVYSFDY